MALIFLCHFNPHVVARQLKLYYLKLKLSLCKLSNYHYILFNISSYW